MKIFPKRIGWGKHHRIREKEAQELKVKSNINVGEYKKALDRGTKLYFIIPRKKIDHEFEVELLEDLYFYLKRKSKKEDSRLFDCACVVRKNTTKSIKMFEEIYGKSLNQVYKNAFVHYFGNVGAPSCNAIDRFYEDAGIGKKVINRHRIVEKKDNTELKLA